MIKWFVLLFLGLGNICEAYTGEYAKSITKTLKAEKSTRLFVKTEFGDITLRQWKGDSIAVHATFEFTGVEDWELEHLAKEVDIRFEEWAGTVKVTTEIGEGFENNDGVKVWMTVYVPEYVTVDMFNKYGKIDIPFYNAYTPLCLSAAYGNLNVDTLWSSADADVLLNVSYGKLTVQQCRNAVVRSAYSEVSITTALNLKIKAEKSQITIQRADTVRTEGEGSVFEVIQCGYRENKRN